MNKIDKQVIEIDGIDLTGDLSSVSDEQLWSLLDKAWLNAAAHMSMQVTIKTCRNSMYGATSNKHYAFCNIEVAEDITAEGRNAVHQGEQLTNSYFNHSWHLDYELHAKLRNDPELRDGFVNFDVQVQQLNELDRVLYIDTDSIYVDYEDVMKSILYIGKTNVQKAKDLDLKTVDEVIKHFKLEQHTDSISTTDHADITEYHEFIVKMHEYKMTSYYNDELAKLIKARHGESVLEFDVETIADTAVFLAKKQYIQTLKWQDGRTYDDPINHIKAKGVELIKSNASKLIRDMLWYGYQLVLSGKITDTLSYKKMMHKLWRRFESEQNIELLCMYTSIDKYTQCILEDTETVKWAASTLPQYRGCAAYNWLVKKYKLENKYQLIETDRIYWYIVDRNAMQITPPFHLDSFAFIPEDMPAELCELVPIDKPAMFYKLVTRPLERLVGAFGIDCSNVMSTTVIMPLL